MQKISIEEAIEQIVKKDPRYPKDAYHFVRDALDYTIKHQKKNPQGKEQHVNGKELLVGVQNFALHEYGPLSFTLLKYWNLHRSDDIGEVVYNMVSMRILRTTEKDSQDDFKDGYDFEETFRRPFEPEGQPSAPVKKSAKLGSTKPS
jgi:uncharacterized repeat protein (TIGR04138 family)